MPKVKEDQIKVVVGRAVQRHRIACELTQEHVAEQLGIGNEAVSRIERGIAEPTITRLAQLADIFKCELSDLVTEGSNRPNDRANHLAQLLGKLDSNDREMITEIVERLAGRLSTRQRRSAAG
jgi:transcriptional regulator with XRE-family HTH domain